MNNRNQVIEEPINEIPLRVKLTDLDAKNRLIDRTGLTTKQGNLDVQSGITKIPKAQIEDSAGKKAKYSVIADENGDQYRIYQGSFAKGGFGKVKDVQRVLDGKWFVLKVLKADKTQKIHLEKENKILRDVGMGKGHLSEYMGKPKDGKPGEKKRLLLMERAPGDDMHSFSKQKKINPFKALETGISMLDAIDKLHQTKTKDAPEGYVHRDIKPANMMVDKSGKVRLIDMGLATSMRNGVSIGGGRAGTLGYMAPEITNPGPPIYSRKSDVYAAGVSLIRLYGLGYLNNSHKVVFDPNNSVARQRIPSATARMELCELFKKMIDDNPLKRPSLSQVKQKMLSITQPHLNDERFEHRKIAVIDVNDFLKRKVSTLGRLKQFDEVVLVASNNSELNKHQIEKIRYEIGANGTACHGNVCRYPNQAALEAYLLQKHATANLTRVAARIGIGTTTQTIRPSSQIAPKNAKVIAAPAPQAPSPPPAKPQQLAPSPQKPLPRPPTNGAAKRAAPQQPFRKIPSEQDAFIQRIAAVLKADGCSVSFDSQKNLGLVFRGGKQIFEFNLLKLRGDNSFACVDNRSTNKRLMTPDEMVNHIHQLSKPVQYSSLPPLLTDVLGYLQNHQLKTSIDVNKFNFDSLQAASQLKNKPVGEFIIRASTKMQGAIAVSYVSDQNQVMQGLYVKNKKGDYVDAFNTGKSLDNFVRELTEKRGLQHNPGRSRPS